ncbi:MAG: DUF2147 domain-containing protein [Arachidicoccus sp.]|nr:DUF2147 domain-containing protein [Arachidicoccus sp.]
MYRKILFAAMILISTVSFAQSQNDIIIGKWKDDAGDRTIEFVKTDAGYNAIIRTAEDASLVGKIQISHLQKKDATHYINGTLYIITKNKTAKCSVEADSNNELVITGKMGMFSKSQKWTRVD